MEYEKKYHKPSSATSKTALGLGIAGTGLGLLNSGGGILGALMGPRLASAGYPGGVVAFADGGCGPCGYVTEKEICLIRESASKDSIIAKLEAEKYADERVRAETDPLNQRICALETATAVNAARDHDFRHYVEREFVHQPKAKIRESIVTCKHCGCECDCC